MFRRPLTQATPRRLAHHQQLLPVRLSSSTTTSPDPVTREVVKSEHDTQQRQSLTEIRPHGSAVAAAVTSGAPEELSVRPVRIYRPAPTTMQSAKSTSHLWKLDWDTLQGSGRWANPLMGWASSADYMQGTNVQFKSKDDAIAFCEKQGWPYFIQEPQQQKFKVKSYSNNYLYSADKLRIVKTK